MTKIIDTELVEVSGYFYGREYVCNICGKAEAEPIAPVFTPPGGGEDETFGICNDCLAAGPEQMPSRLEKHIQEVETRIKAENEERLQYVELLKATQKCVLNYPDIEVMRQARQKAIADFEKDISLIQENMT